MNLITEFNIALFRYTNQFFANHAFDHFKYWLNNIGDYRNFNYHLLVFGMIAIFLLYQQRNNHTALKKLLTLGFAASLCFIVTILIGLAAIVETIKHYTLMIRPLCSLNNVYILKESLPLDCYASFPSGHVSFAIVFIASFWLLFNRFFKCLALLYIALLAISRVASGAHFPLDVIGAVVICLPLTILIRIYTLELTRKYVTKWQIFRLLKVE